jgi:3-hydroxyisobutyrate dehydrogenase-like beta-hydroxyacid dehydrogenase
MTMRVGFVGLGDIGRPMAERLARHSSFDLTVFDASAERTAGVVKLGGHAAGSLGELAMRCDLVEIAVRTADQVFEVVLGQGGLFYALGEGSIIAVHSTVSPGAMQEIAGRCAERGINVLDVAMSGGAHGAERGSLTFMVGGDPAVVERCRAVFEVMSGAIFHLGGVGAGQAGKLVNNLLYNICIVGAAECVRLAAAAGISEETAVALLRVSAGNSYVIEHWDFCMKHEPEKASRVSSVRHKDVSLALDLAERLKVDTPVASLAQTRIDWAIAPTLR